MIANNDSNIQLAILSDVDLFAYTVVSSIFVGINFRGVEIYTSMNIKFHG